MGNRFLELLETTRRSRSTCSTPAGSVARTTTSGPRRSRSPTRRRCSRASSTGRSSGRRTRTSATYVAKQIPGFDDPELLQPRRLYEQQGRQWRSTRRSSSRLKTERAEYLAGFEHLAPVIAKSAGV
jgi:phosphoenolpyruvate carboxykinase (ATP)